MRITAASVCALLAERHRDDLLAFELSTAPMGSSSRARFDAWATERSHSRPTVHGYEIKVTRADWLSDKKLTGYARYCNCMWLVTAPGVVLDEQELPGGFGWQVVASTGTRLVTKRKAAHMPMTDADARAIYRMLLVNRAQIVSDPGRGPTGDIDDWLSGRELDKRAGRALSKRMAVKHGTDVEAVRAENKALVAKIAEYAEVEKVLVGLGIKIQDRVAYAGYTAIQVQSAIRELMRTPEFDRAATLAEEVAELGARLASSAARMRAALTRIRSTLDAPATADARSPDTGVPEPG